ncbi:MAG: hypothetical protein OZ921_21380 [Sorangiineae bacterium]|nr:hypothetical protein [Polyangiaceae bacterium]MEB2325080.1 hypothetical protein [Sorangiineae bacterium]
MSSPDRRERRRAGAVLVVMVACFMLYALTAVPRLTNNHLSDVEFTGWSAPLAERILAGERPYEDFVLPIPPGSFLVIALMQKLSGRVLLLHEIWLNEVIHLLMGLLAYLMAARFTSRRIALMVAACTLVTVVQLNKEIPYDHTALSLAWASVTSGAVALTSLGRRRRVAWLVAGITGGLTMAFKQSTGLGVLLGWLVAFGYLALVEAVGGARAVLARVARDALAWGVAAGVGLLATLGMVLALGSSFGAYFQAVFVDGPALKGGTTHLVFDLLRYVAYYDAFPTTVVFAFLIVGVAARVARFHGSLHLGDEPAREDALTERRAGAIAAAVAVAFGLAVVLLRSPIHRIDPSVGVWFDRLKVLPMFGFAFACAYLVSHLRLPGDETPAAAPLRAGHALNALFLAALVASLFHNTSAPEFRAFYDNNPLIPLVLLSLFTALARARLPRLEALFLVGILACLFGNKLGRAMAATIPMGKSGYWAGMKVSPRGRTIAEAALRVRALAGPSETVLVLPEDLEIAALIGRARPPLRGAILYVDQYPKRLYEGDRRALLEHPPKVIVIHPRERIFWTNVFRTWSADSATERMIDFVERELLPRSYRRDQSFETSFLGAPSHLDIYVRRDDGAAQSQ